MAKRGNNTLHVCTVWSSFISCWRVTKKLNSFFRPCPYSFYWRITRDIYLWNEIKSKPETKRNRDYLKRKPDSNVGQEAIKLTKGLYLYLVIRCSHIGNDVNTTWMCLWVIVGQHISSNRLWEQERLHKSQKIQFAIHRWTDFRWLEILLLLLRLYSSSSKGSIELQHI